MRDRAHQLVAEEVAAFGAARTAGNSMAAWRALERAHIEWSDQSPHRHSTTRGIFA
jgi:hypothetical protein